MPDLLEKRVERIAARLDDGADPCAAAEELREITATSRRSKDAAAARDDREVRKE